MIANLTTPLIGIVSTIAIGRLGDATLLGGVAISSVVFDCLFWLFGFLRMGTLAFTAQPLAAILLDAMGGSEGVTRAAKTYFAIRIWSAPLALANYVVLGWLVGQARARLALAVQMAINLINAGVTAVLVLSLDAGIAGAAIAAVIAEASGLALGLLIARRLNAVS